MNPITDLSLLEDSAQVVAPKLLGYVFQRRIGNKLLSAKIVETEAYDQTDVASHSYNGETKRTKIMFGPSGYLYVYFTYGMHYCCNIVVGPQKQGSAVLIRAVEPIIGIDEMNLRRPVRSKVELTNGPAKLCQALGIDMRLNGHDLHKEPLLLVPDKLRDDETIIQTTRIGISKDKDRPWRFYISNNPYVSIK